MRFPCHRVGAIRPLTAFFLGLVSLAPVALTIGCGASPDSAPAESSATDPASGNTVAAAPVASGSTVLPTPRSPDELLDRMAAAYRNADSYADRGELRLEYPQADRATVDTANFAVQFERPGKLAAAIYQATIAVDGKSFRARLEDLEGQVLVRPAPAKLTIEELYADEVLGSVLTEGLARSSPQLDLLLGGGSLDQLRKAAEAQAAGSTEIDGRLCDGVRLTQNEGAVVLWIDRASYELRRIEYAVGHLLDGARLVAELRDARLGANLDPAVFQFDVPAGAREVVRLIPPPAPLPAVLGKNPGPFDFLALDGQSITPESLAGKVAVLEFWFAGCPPCAERMPELAAVYRRFRDHREVQFAAVSVDDASVTNEQLLEACQQWGAEVPLARDGGQQARQLFGIEAFPQLLLLGRDGTVQSLDSPLGGDILADLGTKIERLLAGENLSEELIALDAEQRTAFEEALEAAAPERAVSAEDVLKAKVAPRTEPQRLRLEPLWRSDSVRLPGNLLVVEGDKGNPQVFVVEGAAGVAELDSRGNKQGSYDLGLPEGELITFLRTAVDAQGRRYYAGSASSQRQVHLYDAGWKHIGSFPTEGEPAGVSDAQFVDLDGNGQLELAVGYWGDAGVQLFAFDGTARWSNATLNNVSRLLVWREAPADRNRLWAGNDRGTLVPLDESGKRGKEFELRGRFLVSTFAMPPSESGATSFCGLTVASLGHSVAVGFGREMREKWNYPLPPGVHQRPVELAASGPVLSGEGDCWLLAGPDGSIHFLSAAGDLLERFNYGEHLTGLAAARIDGRPVLLVSSARGVEALRIEAQ